MNLEHPGRADRGGYLYIVEYSTGAVKVGSSNNPRVRIGQHRVAASIYGVKVSRSWTTARHENYLETEPLLIETAGRIGRRTVKREYFVDIDYDELVDEAEALPIVPMAGYPLTDGDVEARVEQALAVAQRMTADQRARLLAALDESRLRPAA